MTPERFARLRAVLSRRQPDLTVLMDGVHKPYNLSAVARSCDAVGVMEIHTVPVRDHSPLDPDVSAGVSKWLPTHAHESMAAAATRLRSQGSRLVAAHPDPDAVDFREVDYTRPTTFVIGSELHGLSNETLALVDRTVAIPMAGMVRSLNVSVAAALLLYEAQRQRAGAGFYDTSRLEPDRFRRLLFAWSWPEVALRCDEAKEPYPALTDEGEIVLT